MDSNGASFSNQEKRALILFRPVAEAIFAGSDQVDDDYLIRWLRARNLNVDKAEQMLRASIQWRDAVGIQANLGFRAPDIIENHFLYKFTGEDAFGRPILVAPFGRFDIRRVVESGLREDIMKYVRRILEEVMIEISKRRKKKVTQAVFLFDSEGLTFRTVTHIESVRVVYQALKEFESNYPEILHSCYVLNAVWVFQYAFNLLKPILSSCTLSKIEIYDGSNGGRAWRSVLLARLPQDSIPCEYGGTGQPFFSDASENQRVIG